ncbi:MAG: aspartate--tRNA ligase [bacterium]|nr:aspartate--tRNA ligase [bacterium]
MKDSLISAPRSCYCGEVTTPRVGRQIVLKGWVHRRRDHGGIIFIDLRDRTGLVQVVFDPEEFSAELFERASHLKYEDVLVVFGRVRPRPEGTVNPNMKTGEVEVLLSGYEILNAAATLPFPLDEHARVSEDLRLKYRYLDLRRPEMQRNIIERARVARIMRRHLDGEGFIEVETPCLTRSTPEGARDFLVPSRLNPGAFYALPQSPQLFKQLLMVSGFDRYYQIVRCFRDEDLRANRQPEFTQLDIEMSFIRPEDLYPVMEGMMAAIFTEMKGLDIATPFDRLSYDDAMARYGSDKPDRRFGLEIRDLTVAIQSGGCNFKVFSEIAEKGGAIRAIRVPGGGDKYSNTQLKPGGELPSHAERHGAKGLAWFRVVEKDGVTSLDSSIAKFFEPPCQAAIIAALEAVAGDLILIVADRPATAAVALGQLRLKLGRDLGLIPEGVYNFCWITDFPLLEWDAAERRWSSMHHPFTMPHPEDWHRLESDPGAVRSLAYDLALNGEEIGGGSIRIHRPDLQQRVFRVLGIGDEEARNKFGFLMDAFQYGAPPHGGIAFGLDRMMMILLGVESIRDVIAFPKTQTGTCLMTSAPAEVDDKQLQELALRSTARKKEA